MSCLYSEPMSSYLESHIEPEFTLSSDDNIVAAHVHYHHECEHDPMYHHPFFQHDDTPPNSPHLEGYHPSGLFQDLDILTHDEGPVGRNGLDVDEFTSVAPPNTPDTIKASNFSSLDDLSDIDGFMLDDDLNRRADLESNYVVHGLPDYCWKFPNHDDYHNCDLPDLKSNYVVHGLPHCRLKSSNHDDYHNCDLPDLESNYVVHGLPHCRLKSSNHDGQYNWDLSDDGFGSSDNADAPAIQYHFVSDHSSTVDNLHLRASKPPFHCSYQLDTPPTTPTGLFTNYSASGGGYEDMFEEVAPLFPEFHSPIHEGLVHDPFENQVHFSGIEETFMSTEHLLTSPSIAPRLEMVMEASCSTLESPGLFPTLLDENWTGLSRMLTPPEEGEEEEEDHEGEGKDDDELDNEYEMVVVATPRATSYMRRHSASAWAGVE